MKKLFTFFVGILLIVTANAQAPQLAWAKTFSNTSAATDSTSVMKLYTTDNSVYIAGTSDAFGKGNDIVLIKRDFTTGEIIWTKNYNGAANGDDQAVDLVINQTTGDVFVTGKSMGNGTAYDVVILKYTSSGVLDWVNRWDNENYHGDDIPKSSGIDNSGNIYIIGTTFEGNTNLNDLLRVCYYPSGNILLGNYFTKPQFSWYKNTDYDVNLRLGEYGYTNSMDNVGQSKVSNSGQVYVAGDFLMGNSNIGYRVVFTYGYTIGLDLARSLSDFII